MKKVLLILLITVFSLQSYSQDFKGGIVLGVSGSQIDGDTQSGYQKPGLILGAFVMKPVSKNGSLKIETYYIGKGAVNNIDYADGTIYQKSKASLHYIEMPFLYNLQIHPKIDVSLGIAPSYLFMHKLFSDRQLIDKNLYSIKTFDFQPIAQVGYYLTDRISASIRFSYSVLSIRNDDVLFNNNLGIALRYIFE